MADKPLTEASCNHCGQRPENPPPYLQHEPASPSPEALDSGWDYNHVRDCQSYWTRTVPNTTWLQYGISEATEVILPAESVPDLVFTCKMRSRTEDAIGPNVELYCGAVAQTLRSHRGWSYSECSCNFENMLQCPVLENHQYFKSTRYWIGLHDASCSCGCFNQAKQGDPEAPCSDWQYSYKGHCFSHWTRTRRDTGWIQYGVSKSFLEKPSDDGPDVYFTCKMRTTIGSGRRAAVLKSCKAVAGSLRHHHGHESLCSCNIENVMQCSSLDTPEKRRGQWTWFDYIRYWMAKHDSLCSCGCFDVTQLNDNASLKSDLDQGGDNPPSQSDIQVSDISSSRSGTHVSDNMPSKCDIQVNDTKRPKPKNMGNKCIVS